MPSTSCARYRSKNSVTTAAADSAVRGRWLTSVIVASPLASGDRDLVVALHGQAPVQLGLAPVRGDLGDQAAAGHEPPGLVDVQVLLLVDGAGVAGRLGSLGLEQRGDDVAGGNDPADADHQVGEAAHQVGQDLAQFARAMLADAERVDGDGDLRVGQGDGRVDVVAGEGVQERLYG